MTAPPIAIASLLLSACAARPQASAPAGDVAHWADARADLGAATASAGPVAPPSASPDPAPPDTHGAPAADLGASVLAMPSTVDEAGGSVRERSPTAKDDPPADPGRLLVFTGGLTLRVDGDAIASRIDQVVSIAASVGGYVARQDDRAVQVRVPSAQFRHVMRSIGELGEVLSRTVNAADVTEEFHDLEVRLQSLRATRDRLEDFLERAASIEEVLRVESELARIAGEIDRVEGRMRFLRSNATFSTISVAIEPRPATVVAVDTPPPPPPPPSTLSLPVSWLPAVGLGRLLDLHT